ncbi:TPA: hypothetical protein RVE07_000246 [Escherichia coli]|uniref:hypothetical protein n=1 Tax=Pseudomonadota TaxID=1224 RepID=UPI00287CB2B2|nr:hypothetical protein [Escherichia coli]HEA1240615.1 hypothetical protein [Escherichia coli]HEA1932962.1 hypothetical protein [Escherichia coli]HEA2340383.1 hypothetical protein [Escherichia coli]
MSLMQWAFVLFAAGACGGVSLALLVALKIRFPAWFGTAHGLLGLLALIVLFIANLHAEDATPASAWWALGLLAAALSGGLIFFRTLFPGRAPLTLAALHGGLALAGVYLLYRAAFVG